MKNREILFVDLAGSFGGIETYLANLSQILAGQLQMHAICVNAHLRDLLREKNVHVVPERMKDRGKVANLLLAGVLLIWMRLRLGISIVWIQGYSEIALLPLAKLIGCKAVATRHLTMDSEASRLTSKIARKVYEHLAFTADQIFCVSSVVASDLRHLVNESRLAAIPNWVPSIPELPSALSDDHELRLLFVGRLQPHKGTALILDAMRELQSRNCRRRFSLTIVGEGECRRELECLGEGLDVRFAGFQNDPSVFYREAHVFINPSLGPEGLPLVSLEAMSYGLPCIFSDLEVHKEISGNGESAALFRANNALELASRVETLAANPALRSIYGQKAHASITARHSPQGAKTAYLEYLDRLRKAA